MAGPESPAKRFLKIGLFESKSTAMPRKVFTREIQSAPACSADIAIEEISLTFGESFTIKGLLVLCFIWFTNL